MTRDGNGTGRSVEAVLGALREGGCEPRLAGAGGPATASTAEVRVGTVRVGVARNVVALCSPERPVRDGLVVLASPRVPAEVYASGVAVLVIPDDADASNGVSANEPLVEAADDVIVIHVRDTRLALALLTRLFDARPRLDEGVHPSAVVHPRATLGADVRVGAHAEIGADVVLGDGASVGAGCVIGAGSFVGASSVLHANVTVYDGVRIGARVVVHSGAVLGADGFGYARGPRGAVKIHHLGGVVLEDDVEIGANACVDRGTLADTRVGARTKIDNHCQIAHNVVIGSDCLLAGGVAVAGSSRIGRGVTLAGHVGVVDHVVIGDGVTVTARSLVTKSVPAGETWAGYPAQPYRKWVRGLYLQGRLEAIWRFVKGSS